jgi:hypothetical protein
VLWGVVWGLFVHISIFFMLFNMKKGPKREDRVFGYWLGFSAAVVVAVGVVAVAAAMPNSPGATEATQAKPAATSGRPYATFDEFVPHATEVPTVSATTRSIDEILQAVKAKVPNFCEFVPSLHHSLTDYELIEGPTREPDGTWRVICSSQYTYSSGSKTPGERSDECYRVNDATLIVTNEQGTLADLPNYADGYGHSSTCSGAP